MSPALDGPIDTLADFLVVLTGDVVELDERSTERLGKQLSADRLTGGDRFDQDNAPLGTPEASHAPSESLLARE